MFRFKSEKRIGSTWHCIFCQDSKSYSRFVFFFNDPEVVKSSMLLHITTLNGKAE